MMRTLEIIEVGAWLVGGVAAILTAVLVLGAAYVFVVGLLWRRLDVARADNVCLEFLVVLWPVGVPAWMITRFVVRVVIIVGSFMLGTWLTAFRFAADEIKTPTLPRATTFLFPTKHVRGCPEVKFLKPHECSWCSSFRDGTNRSDDLVADGTAREEP